MDGIVTVFNRQLSGSKGENVGRGWFAPELKPARSGPLAGSDDPSHERVSKGKRARCE